MAKIKEITRKFEASDGADFDSKAEAERHQKLIDATNAFEEAQKTLCRTMAETIKTADGKLFDFEQSRYWYIQEGYAMPQIRDVHFYKWHMRFSLDELSRLFLVESERGHDHTERYTHHDIANLYADEDAAKKALVAACEERMASYRRDIDGMKKSK